MMNINKTPHPPRFSRTRLYLCIWLASLWLSTQASADPVHLRAPIDQPSLGWSVGAGTLISFGVWNLPQLGTAFYTRLAFDSTSTSQFFLGSALATKFRIAGQSQGFRLDGYIMGGIEYQVTPLTGMGAMASLTFQGVYQRKGAVFAIELIGPFSFQFAPTLVARLPVMAGAWLMFRAGKMWFGIYANVGPNLVIGQPTELLYHFALVWAIQLPGLFRSAPYLPQA